jgi:uncharacterized protein GlcG (DUF336 family)
MQHSMKGLFIVSVGFLVSSPAMADGNCNIPKDIVDKVQATLATAAQSGNGGIFTPNRMWSAVVDRTGVVCSVITNNADAWPGSRAIAMAKAFTANAFSNSALALSTANLYSLTQPANSNAAPAGGVPAGSLYGLNNSNPFNPDNLPQRRDIGQVAGGMITFGGGVALYVDGQVIGGLGVSGDSACADHAIAYKMRALAGLASTPNNDNIAYLSVGELPNGFKHPHCLPSDITP